MESTGEAWQWQAGFQLWRLAFCSKDTCAITVLGVGSLAWQSWL